MIESYFCKTMYVLMFILLLIESWEIRLFVINEIR